MYFSFPQKVKCFLERLKCYLSFKKYNLKKPGVMSGLDTRIYIRWVGESVYLFNFANKNFHLSSLLENFCLLVGQQKKQHIDAFMQNFYHAVLINLIFFLAQYKEGLGPQGCGILGSQRKGGPVMLDLKLLEVPHLRFLEAQIRPHPQKFRL